MSTRKRKHIGIIGVPLDLGAGRRGVDMGPSAIRIADLQKRLESIGHKVVDNIRQLFGSRPNLNLYLTEISWAAHCPIWHVWAYWFTVHKRARVGGSGRLLTIHR